MFDFIRLLKSRMQPNTKFAYSEAFTWLIYVLGGALLQVFVGFILAKLYFRELIIDEFFKHGEFAVYSVALLTPSIYIVNKDQKMSIFPYKSILSLFSYATLMISVIMYAGVVSALPISMPIDQIFLRWSSIILFIMAVLLAFSVTYNDNKRVGKDIEKELGKGYEILEDQFNNMGDAK